MKMTGMHIIFTLDLRDTLLSLYIGFSFVRVAVACAVLERTSCSGLSSETNAPRYPRYLKHVTVPSFCLFSLIPIWMLLIYSALISICQLGLLVPAHLQLEHLCHLQNADCNISVAYDNLSIMFFKSIMH